MKFFLFLCFISSLLHGRFCASNFGIGDRRSEEFRKSINHSDESLYINRAYSSEEIPLSGEVPKSLKDELHHVKKETQKFSEILANLGVERVNPDFAELSNISEVTVPVEKQAKPSNLQAGNVPVAVTSGSKPSKNISVWDDLDEENTFVKPETEWSFDDSSKLFEEIEKLNEEISSSLKESNSVSKETWQINKEVFLAFENLLKLLRKSGHVLNRVSTNLRSSCQVRPIRVIDKDIEVAWIKDKITLRANTSLEEIENLAEQYMKHINNISAERLNKLQISLWAFSSNITESNKIIAIEAAVEHGAFLKQRWKDVQTWQQLRSTLTNENLKRQLQFFSFLGVPVLPEEKYEKWASLTAELEEIYSTATICDFHNPSKCDLSLEPDLTEILANSRDYDELAYVWKEWRDKSGKPMKDLYSEYVDLGNEAAKLNDFHSMAEMWIDDYESQTFEENIAELFKQMTPLYNQLHAYTRRKLREVYGEDRISKSGAIPAHLLGNMWAQSWDRIYDLLVPYPNKTSLDVTDAMIARNYTPQYIFEEADDFFASLGLKRVGLLFWNNSILKKPADRELVCHASAWDFADGEDFRIKQCTRVNNEDFDTAHHEMGHIQYYLQYRDLPHVFRGGANQGFHEAIGDIMSLSVSTPKHLHKVGLLEELPNDYEADINFLMISALRKVAFLPFGYLIDKWRWDVFRGLVTPDNYTCAWWNYRYNLQGIKPPPGVARTSADFDAGAKYHVPANSKYIQYFVSFVLQFQFHKSLCLVAGEYDPTDPQKPLHQCDIYQSLEAGNALRVLLKVGSSQHWTVTLKNLTGTDKMDLSPLMEYFAPLEKWLLEDNIKHGEFIGWEGGHGVC